MIEKRPYWHEPGYFPEFLEQIEESQVAQYSPLTGLPISFSRWCYDAPLDDAPIFCSYLFSDGTNEKYLLSHQNASPSGQLMLKVTITNPSDEDCSNHFTLEKVRPNCFVMSHHYSEPEYRFNPDDEEDWEDVAMRMGTETYYPASHIKDGLSREDAIASSPFRDLYLEAVSERNKKVSELMFDRTFTGVFDHLTKQLPFYIKSTSCVPSLKTGHTFDRFYFLDNPSEREIKSNLLYFGKKFDIAKDDVIIYQAMLHNGKNLCYRNQPIARIQSNGEITWQSFEDKQIFSLEVRDFLQELLGDKVEVVNREINEAAMMNGPFFSSEIAKEIEETQGSIIYDKYSEYGGDLLIIKAEPDVLAINFVVMLRTNFGLTPQAVLPTRGPDPRAYHSELDFQFELYGYVDPTFTHSFYEALSDPKKGY